MNTSRCRAIEAYVEECQENHVQLLDWRSKTSCGRAIDFLCVFLLIVSFVIVQAQSCSSANMVYVQCISSCPRTCQNPQSSVSQCYTLTNECTSGCVCSNETVFDPIQNQCVPLEQCSCSYNKQLYQAGDQVSIDCNDW
jgi:hypothetical protein